MPPVRGACVAIDISKLDRALAPRPYQPSYARTDRAAVLEEKLKRARAAREEANSRIRALEAEVESYQSLQSCARTQQRTMLRRLLLEVHPDKHGPETVFTPTAVTQMVTALLNEHAEVPL